MDWTITDSLSGNPAYPAASASPLRWGAKIWYDRRESTARGFEPWMPSGFSYLVLYGRSPLAVSQLVQPPPGHEESHCGDGKRQNQGRARAEVRLKQCVDNPPDHKCDQSSRYVCHSASRARPDLPLQISSRSLPTMIRPSKCVRAASIHIWSVTAGSSAGTR